MMNKFTDPAYLTGEQYRTPSNLEARIAIHQRFSMNPQGWYDWVFDTLLGLPGTVNVLELGCGSGLMWRECANRIPEGWTITLTDLSDGMLDAAWRNLVPTGRAYKFEKMDAASISYADETFDMVIANHMLYHVPEGQAAVAGIRRVLKPGGHLIATTVGEGHLREMWDWIRRVQVNGTWEPFAGPFTLENGFELLTPFFTEVTLSRYTDSLQITEVEPLMAYIRSSIRAVELSEKELSNLQIDLEDELKEKGSLFVSKDSGLFKALK